MKIKHLICKELPISGRLAESLKFDNCQVNQT